MQKIRGMADAIGPYLFLALALGILVGANKLLFGGTPPTPTNLTDLWKQMSILAPVGLITSLILAPMIKTYQKHIVRR